jgi:hypothetical protein
MRVQECNCVDHHPEHDQEHGEHNGTTIVFISMFSMPSDQHNVNASICAHHHPEHEQEHDEHTAIVFITILSMSRSMIYTKAQPW